jgi:hypothetical protein
MLAANLAPSDSVLSQTEVACGGQVSTALENLEKACEAARWGRLFY